MGLKRHTLLDITDRGREDILVELAANDPDGDLLKDKYAQIILPAKAGVRVPGVVRREEGTLRPGYIPVGFSSPMTGHGGRLRVAVFARLEDVSQTTSPYELLPLMSAPPRNACNTALALARNQAHEMDLAIGVWGSAALELYTGLPCTHQDSDLDLLVAVAPREALAGFLLKIETIEAQLDLRIDVELDLANGYGVHLKELFGTGRAVLGKSLNNVIMLPRQQIFAELPQAETLYVRSNIEGQ